MNPDGGGQQRSHTSSSSSSARRRLPTPAKSPFRKPDRAPTLFKDDQAHHPRLPLENKLPYNTSESFGPRDSDEAKLPADHILPPSRSSSLPPLSLAETPLMPSISHSSSRKMIPLAIPSPADPTPILEPMAYPGRLAQTMVPDTELRASSPRLRQYTLGSGSTIMLGPIQALHASSPPKTEFGLEKPRVEESGRAAPVNNMAETPMGKLEPGTDETSSGGDEVAGRRRRATSKAGDQAHPEGLKTTTIRPVLPFADVSRAPSSALYFSRLPIHGRPPGQALRAHTGTLVGDRIWFIGGVDGEKCWRGVAWLDTETLLWSLADTHGTQLPPLRAHTTTLVGEYLVIFGGGDGPSYSNDVWIFDTVSHRFSLPSIQRSGLPPPRRAHTTTRYRNFLVVFGGGNGQDALNDVWALDVSDLAHLVWKEWKTTGDIPQKKGYHTANVVGDKMVVFGGSDGHASFADVHILDLRTLNWTLVNTDQKHNRLSHTSTQVGSYLFVLGGHNGQAYVQDVLLFNLVTLQWETKSPRGIAPPGRGYHVALLHDARIFVFGGYNGVSVFDDTWVLDLSAAAYLPQVETTRIGRNVIVVLLWHSYAREIFIHVEGLLVSSFAVSLWMLGTGEGDQVRFEYKHLSPAFGDAGKMSRDLESRSCLNYSCPVTGDFLAEDMQDHPLELSESALSPAEHSAYSAYISLLSGTAGVQQAVDQTALRRFAITRLSVPPDTADNLLSRIAPSSTKLRAHQVFAFFRLASHAKLLERSVLHRGRAVDAHMLFVPISPLRILPSPQESGFSEAGSDSRPAASQASSESQNPFLRRPPPLPPRRTSANVRSIDDMQSSPHLASTSSSQTSSILSPRYSPTRRTASSTLIQASLYAAEQASDSRLQNRTVNILHKTASQKDQENASKTPTGLANSNLILEVKRAVQNVDDPLPRPPQRTRSGQYNLEDRVRLSARNQTGTMSWSCIDLFSGLKAVRPYAMIVLNQPITRKDVFVRAWRASEVHLCADGGANRLYDAWNAEQRNMYMPSMIKGDLDSIRSDVKAFYSTAGVPVKYDGDQYSTDLMKCIREVEAIETAIGRQLSLLLFGGLSGRIDQTVHTMSLLHKLRNSRPRSFVLSGESLAWVLDRGKHSIEIDHSTMGETCGILPVGIDEAMVHTRGLKWNIDGKTSLDGLVSTSNHLLPSEPVVTITTNRPVLWCVEIRPHLDKISPLAQTISQPQSIAQKTYDA